jgi:hypothetical protein
MRLSSSVIAGVLVQRQKRLRAFEMDRLQLCDRRRWRRKEEEEEEEEEARTHRTRK